MQVLVVDDEPLVGEFFKDSLKGPSYRITTTLSSREALELAGNKHFDVVFLDLLMPEIDGAEVFRQMRQMGVSASVVIITSYPDGDLMDRATQHGPLMVMRKPFTSGVILEAIRSVLPGEETRA